MMMIWRNFYLLGKKMPKALSVLGHISSSGIPLENFLEQFLDFLKKNAWVRSRFSSKTWRTENNSLFIDAFDMARRELRDAVIPVFLWNCHCEMHSVLWRTSLQQNRLKNVKNEERKNNHSAKRERNEGRPKKSLWKWLFKKTLPFLL